MWNVTKKETKNIRLMLCTCDSEAESEAGVEECGLQLSGEDEPSQAQVQPGLGKWMLTGKKAYYTTATQAYYTAAKQAYYTAGKKDNYTAPKQAYYTAAIQAKVYSC